MQSDYTSFGAFAAFFSAAVSADAAAAAAKLSVITQSESSAEYRKKRENIMQSLPLSIKYTTWSTMEPLLA